MRTSTTCPPRTFICLLLAMYAAAVCEADEIRDLQTAAFRDNGATWGHWGTNRGKYSAWTNHSNRLIPVYTFGISLASVKGENSLYRDTDRLRQLYGVPPIGTLNKAADYFDQTDVYRLQKAAVAAGKKYIVLIVFDGMDWQTSWAASIAKTGRVAYTSGRGTGLWFQDYARADSDFGYFVTSPHNEGTKTDVDGQTVTNIGGTKRGGYDPAMAGLAPWSKAQDLEYLIAKNRYRTHAFTDSASSATSMTCGVKTYNGAINVSVDGSQLSPITRWLQREKQWSIGVVTSVPISHATPACAYANNVHRGDYQDISRDMLGLPSSAHRFKPLPGVDVLIGCGWGEFKKTDSGQGANYVSGNRYLADADLTRIDTRNGGLYEVAIRTSGQRGARVLSNAASRAVANGHRLFGFFGVAPGHLPYQTADGKFDPTIDAKPLEKYTAADVYENPTLAEMTESALSVLETNPEGFWLMVEPGDVDWANHSNNIDNAIGAVLSGDDAFRAVTRWVEAKDAWDETAVIVTADHGHLFVLRDASKLAIKR